VNFLDPSFGMTKRPAAALERALGLL